MLAKLKKFSSLTLSSLFYVLVFKLKENVYISEFELSVDYSFNCMAAVLSDGTAIYVILDNSNVNLDLFWLCQLRDDFLNDCVCLCLDV